MDRSAAEAERLQAERNAAVEQAARERDKQETLKTRKKQGQVAAVSSLAIFNSGAQDTAMRTLFSRTGA